VDEEGIQVALGAEHDFIRGSSRTEIACEAHDVSPGRAFNSATILSTEGCTRPFTMALALSLAKPATDQRASALKFKVYGFLR
jgi:hypothetical protein